ncbi:MAG: glycosyl hydrolase-related protein [Thermomicrobiales bacterium]
MTREAFALNSPLVVLSTAGGSNGGAGFVTMEGVPLGLGSLKPADAGEGLILRIYEPNGARGSATLRFAQAPTRVERVDLLEEASAEGPPLRIEGGSVTLDVRPFEVATLRLVF